MAEATVDLFEQVSSIIQAFGRKSEPHVLLEGAGTAAERAAWWSDASGIPPGAGVGIVDQVAKLGAAFAVSPGTTPSLLDAAKDSPVPLLPGTATASEVMNVLERGYTYMKLFPAEASGGIDKLSSLASPLPAAKFCPTGGIDPEKAKRYLTLPNVVCVGGSWLVPRDVVRQGDWTRITELARGTAALRKGAAQ